MSELATTGVLSSMLAPRADSYQVHLKDFAAFAGAEPVTLGTISGYFRALNEEAVSASTKRVRSALNAEMDFNRRAALQEALAQVDHDVPAPRIQSAPVEANRTINRGEYDALRAKASKRDRLWLAFLWQSGTRISEATGVLLDQCEELGPTVRLRIWGKGSKERFIRIRSGLFAAIRQEFDGKTYLFETSGGKRFSRTYVSARIRKLTLAVLGRKLSAHSLRHSFCTRAVRNNPGKIQAVSAWVGHATVGFTLTRYVHDSLTDDEILDPDEGDAG
jgi:integrase